MTLSKKLILGFVFSILISIFIISIVSGYMINRTFEKYLEREQSNKFHTIFEEINEIYSSNPLALDKMSLMHYSVREGIDITIKDKDNKTLYDSSESGMGMGSMNRRRINMMDRIPRGNYVEKVYELKKDSTVIGRLIIGYLDNSYITDSSILFMDTLKRSLFASGLLAVLMGLLVSILISRQLTKPILDITQTANNLRAGDLSARSSIVNSTAEISQLRESINYLGDTLAKQDSIRKRYASDISHELRTPLTTLKTHIEAISDGIWEPNKEHLDILTDEVLRLTKLVDDLKTSFTQGEYTLQINKSRFNISLELENIIRGYEPIFSKENHLLLSNIEKDIIFNMDREKFNQIIYNLLSNSLHYLKEKGKVMVELYGLEDKIILKISDNGIGIKEEDLENIFNRFYRVDTSRNKETGGTGLGLSIVKSIVEAHKGHIDVESKFGEGTDFIISLPITND